MEWGEIWCLRSFRQNLLNQISIYHAGCPKPYSGTRWCSAFLLGHRRLFLSAAFPPKVGQNFLPTGELGTFFHLAVFLGIVWYCMVLCYCNISMCFRHFPSCFSQATASTQTQCSWSPSSQWSKRLHIGKAHHSPGSKHGRCRRWLGQPVQYSAWMCVVQPFFCRGFQRFAMDLNGSKSI